MNEYKCDYVLWDGISCTENASFFYKIFELYSLQGTIRSTYISRCTMHKGAIRVQTIDVEEIDKDVFTILKIMDQ